MKSFKFLVSLLILILLFTSTLLAQEVKPKIYVSKVNTMDGTLVDPVKTRFIYRIQEKGLEIASSSTGANYIAEITIVSANSRRSFNWLILIFPLWPIVPFTTVQGDALVAVRITDQSGNVIYSDQAGSTVSGRWVFGDFVSEDSVKRDAALECIDKIIANINLE